MVHSSCMQYNANWSIDSVELNQGFYFPLWQSLENISPAVIRKIATEIRKLTETPLEGIKIIPNESDITDIQAIIEGPGMHVQPL